MSKDNIEFVSGEWLNGEFIKACSKGNLDEVKRLYSKYKPRLKSNNSFVKIAQSLYDKFKKDLLVIDVHYYDDRCFRYACDEGQLEVVKYLLTSNELVDKCNIHAEDDYGFRVACEKGYLELAKYLAISPDLKEHANIHANEDQGIINAYHNNHFELVKFFIFDMYIPKSNTIKEYIQEQNAQELDTLFQKRELHQELLSDMTSETTEQRRKLKV